MFVHDESLKRAPTNVIVIILLSVMVSSFVKMFKTLFLNCHKLSPPPADIECSDQKMSLSRLNPAQNRADFMNFEEEEGGV